MSNMAWALNTGRAVKSSLGRRINWCVGTSEAFPRTLRQCPIETDWDGIIDSLKKNLRNNKQEKR